METVSRDWAQALPHRSGDELVVAVQRLAIAGLGPDDVRAVLADLGDALWGQVEGEVATDPADKMQHALLLVELGAFIAYAQERAAAARRATYSALLDTYSVVRLAQSLGVTRQAVHKTVSAQPPRREFVSHIRVHEGESDV